MPCGPENVTANVSCGTGALTVTWDISVPADNYTTKISRGVGQPLHCNSTDMQCTAEGLVCGSSYVVNVFSITGTCISLPSTGVTVQTCEKHRCISILEGGRAGIFSHKVSNWFVFICPQCHVRQPTLPPHAHAHQTLLR